MSVDEFRVCEYLLIRENGEKLLLEASEESGRGKRFGTTGKIPLDQDEAERLAKWILARSPNPDGWALVIARGLSGYGSLPLGRQPTNSRRRRDHNHRG